MLPQGFKRDANQFINLKSIFYCQIDVPLAIGLVGKNTCKSRFTLTCKMGVKHESYIVHFRHCFRDKQNLQAKFFL